MCGIVDWTSFERDLSDQHGQLDAMTGTMVCRGPDAGGTWLRRHAALGHRRLAVIDLPGGAQPMTRTTPAGEVGLVFSGEIYNYVELREELRRRGHAFHTDSDTEVVLVGYLEWGAALAERLNGMYAFAVWDERDEQLVLVRDRMGVKPLYYFPTADGVLLRPSRRASSRTSWRHRSSTSTDCVSCSPSPRHPATRSGPGCTRSSLAPSSRRTGTVSVPTSTGGSPPFRTRTTT